jgi:hypothetical protein
MKDAKTIKVKLRYARNSIPSSRAETGKAHDGGGCRGKLATSEWVDVTTCLECLTCNWNTQAVHIHCCQQ